MEERSCPDGFVDLVQRVSQTPLEGERGLARSENCWLEVVVQSVGSFQQPTMIPGRQFQEVPTKFSGRCNVQTPKMQFSGDVLTSYWIFNQRCFAVTFVRKSAVKHGASKTFSSCSCQELPRFSIHWSVHADASLWAGQSRCVSVATEESILASWQKQRLIVHFVTAAPSLLVTTMFQF